MGKSKTVIVKPLQIAEIKVEIVGTSPYMPEPMDMKVVEKYNKKKAKKVFKEDDMTEDEKVKSKYYFMPDKKTYAIPTRAFYRSMVNAVARIDGIAKTEVTQTIVINEDYVPIKYKSEKVLTHWGRNSGGRSGKGSPRKIMRNAFYDWRTMIKIQFNVEVLSEDQIISILNWAGYHIGIGGFRRENTGNFGMFEVGNATMSRRASRR